MEEKMVAVANEPLKAERNYGIDLLRIVSIFMVLMLHVLMQGGLLYAVDQFTFKGEVVWFLETACYCAVNVYAIISGYVGYKSKPRLKKLLTLWLEVFLYSALFGVVTSLYKFYAYGTPIDVKFLIKCCLPFITNKYWYFSAYVILFALMPMLNVAIEKTATPILRNGLIFVLFAFGFIPNATFMVGGGYSVIWLVVLYLLGGYLAKDKPFEKMPSWLCFVLYFFPS